MEPSPNNRIYQNGTDAHSGVERSTADRPTGEGRDHDGESDCQAVEGVTLGLGGCGRVEHHEREGEGEEKLHQQRGCREMQFQPAPERRSFP